ncbi:acyltransferase [Leptolyngbya sp. DQ-M1]|uniref:acyltransferase n=1 Tax=Leptolyngbya sp. DQ-M1 TaxID=2933920 RepID=UPI00329A4DFE
MSLAKDASITTPKGTCYVGITHFGNATPRNSVTVVVCASQSTLALDGEVCIGRGTILSVAAKSNLGIGEGTYIADGSRIYASTSIQIGRRCAISFGVTILDDDGHGFGLPPYTAPICIEDNVWIGCNATILKGVTIGEGSVVAAGAVVTRSCPPHSLLAGVPARVIREGVVWTDAERLHEAALGAAQKGVDQL